LLRLPVWVDTQFYTSLFAAAVDNEFSYHMLHQKIKQNSGSPIKYSGHTIILDSWLKEHPEYKSKSDEVEK